MLTLRLELPSSGRAHFSTYIYARLDIHVHVNSLHYADDKMKKTRNDEGSQTSSDNGSANWRIGRT